MGMSRRAILGLAATAVGTAAFGLPELSAPGFAAIATTTPVAGAWEGVAYADAVAALADRGIVGCDPDSWASTGAPQGASPTTVVANGADQTAELQAAVDAARLVVLIGAVRVSKTVTITKSNLTIQAGQIVSSAPGAVFQVTGASNVLIHEMSFVMPTKGAVAVQAAKSSQVTVRAVSVATGRIFAASGANRQVRVDGCHRVDMTPFSAAEFQAGYFGAGIDVSSCTQVVVCGNTFAGYADGIRFTGASNGSIFGNQVVQVGNEAVWSTTNTGGHLYQGAGGIWGSKATQMLVFGNYVDGVADVGVDFEGCTDCAAYRNEVWNCNNAELAAFSCNRGVPGTTGFNTDVVFDSNYAAIDGTSPWVRHGSGSYLAWPKIAYGGSAQAPAIEGGDVTLRNNTFTAVNTNAWQLAQVWTPVSGGTLTVSGNRFVNAQLCLAPEDNGSLSETGAQNSASTCTVSGNVFTLSDVAARRLAGPPICVGGTGDSVVTVTGNLIAYAGSVCDRSIRVSLSNTATSAASVTVTNNQVSARAGQAGSQDVYISWTTSAPQAAPPQLTVAGNTLTTAPAIAWSAPGSPPAVSASNNATRSGARLPLQVQRIAA